ncbi:hypothetical protein GYMLUDRAFT_85895, partial [Collybiopsis luxurians FD-317 M1]
MQAVTRLLFLLSSSAFLAEALPISQTTRSVPAITLDGWNSLCGCFSDNLYFSNLCFDIGSSAFGFAFSESTDICIRQNVADSMIFLAKSSAISESAEFISFAVAYNQLAFSSSSFESSSLESSSFGSSNIVSVARSTSSCSYPPVNPELSGSVSVPSGVSTSVPTVGTSNGPISSVPASTIPTSTGNITDGTTDSNSTLTGTDSTNSTDFSGSNSTDTSNSTLTGSDSSNSTDTSSTDTSSTSDSGNSTDTSSATDSATDSSTDTAAATATDTSVASATDSSTA